MPAHSCFRLGPNGEWIRQPDDGSNGRVDYITIGRSWPSNIEITMERMTAPTGWLEFQDAKLKKYDSSY